MDQPDTDTQDRQQAVSALQRKTRVGQEVRQSKTISLAKALRLSLAKVADQQMGLAAAVIGARVETVQQDALDEVFDDATLLMLLDGTLGRRGAVAFDADLVGGLIQQQTMGKVSAPFGGDPRPMTDTDAAICTPFIEGFMSRSAKLPDEEADRVLLEGYQFGARVANTRLLLMALGRPEYSVIHLTVDLAGGARQGRIMLCLPEGADSDLVMDASGDGDVEGVKPPAAQLDKTVLALKVELNVALTSLTMPLGTVQRLQKGDVYDLGITAFDAAVVQTVEGKRVGAGVLGQINGTRALQLEHAKVPTHQPRRRAADRATLSLPNVEGDGTGTRKSDAVGIGQGKRADDTAERSLLPPPQMDMAAAPVGDLPPLGDMPDLPDLPDMSDLPGMDDLSDLPDLPDMPDLPNFDDEEPQSAAG